MRETSSESKDDINLTHLSSNITLLTNTFHVSIFTWYLQSRIEEDNRKTFCTYIESSQLLLLQFSWWAMHSKSNIIFSKRKFFFGLRTTSFWKLVQTLGHLDQMAGHLKNPTDLITWRITRSPSERRKHWDISFASIWFLFYLSGEILQRRRINKRYKWL